MQQDQINQTSATPLDRSSIEILLKREGNNREMLENTLKAKQQNHQQLTVEIERLRGALEYNTITTESLKRDLAILAAAAEAAQKAAGQAAQSAQT